VEEVEDRCRLLDLSLLPLNFLRNIINKQEMLRLWLRDMHYVTFSQTNVKRLFLLNLLYAVALSFVADAPLLRKQRLCLAFELRVKSPLQSAMAVMMSP
jgi:hypothetical protein